MFVADIFVDLIISTIDSIFSVPGIGNLKFSHLTPCPARKAIQTIESDTRDCIHKARWVFSEMAEGFLADRASLKYVVYAVICFNLYIL